MKTVSRLVRIFQPEHYNLSIKLDRTNREFNGTVTINGELMSASDEIRLHAKDLAITGVVLDGKQASWSHEDHDELVITHPDITPGKHILVVSFSGQITDSMHGLYPCYYEHEGVEKELLATQFESHHAREVFPCIDEPEAKAIFDVTLTTETGVTALSNMPIKTQTEEKGRLVTTFDPTPKMSSYLLAWVVGEMHKKTAHTKSGVEVNVWATMAQPTDNLDFALDIATRTIDFFDEYFETPYPLPKSDHVALPDFSSGAMENWGLITYRETALLAHPKTTSIDKMHYIATVIAHELSHQWFGNLVTMQWWDDLWLNESFATMMEYLAIDNLHPEWQIWQDHASIEVISALRRDSLDGVQPIQTDVHHPDEIATLFDGSIVYAKGSRMLRMLQTYIGDKAMQDGLKLYFSRHAYGNTSANDLWYALGDTSKQDITDFMNTWISQPGYPVVHVEEKDGQVTLSQERFFIGPNKSSDQLWPIPLNSSCSEMPKLFDQRSVTVKRTHKTPLSFNVGSSAHFITHYSHELMQQLLDNLDTMTEIDRLQLLHEQTLLAQAGIISSADLISLVGYFTDDTSEPVWSIIALTINELKKFVENNDQAEKKLKNLSVQIAKKQYDRLGWQAIDNESENDTKLRSIIIGLMLYGEDQEALKIALGKFNSNSPEDLDPELRTSIMLAAVRSDTGRTVIDKLLKIHQNTNSSQLQDEISAAITGTRSSDSIDFTLGLLKDPKRVRPQDFLRWYVGLIRNRFARDKTWAWAKDNWQWITDTFKNDMSYDAFPRYVASALISEKHLNEYQDFFEPLKSEHALRRNIEIGIGELTGRVDLIKRDGQTVISALIKS